MKREKRGGARGGGRGREGGGKLLKCYLKKKLY